METTAKAEIVTWLTNGIDKLREDAGAPASGVVVLPAPLGDEAEEDAVEV